MLTLVLSQRTFDTENLLVKADCTLCTNLANNRLLIKSNRGMVNFFTGKTLVFAAIICDDTCQFL